MTTVKKIQKETHDYNLCQADSLSHLLTIAFTNTGAMLGCLQLFYTLPYLHCSPDLITGDMLVICLLTNIILHLYTTNNTFMFFPFWTVHVNSD